MERCMETVNIFGKAQDIGMRENTSSILRMVWENIILTLTIFDKECGKEVFFNLTASNRCNND